MIYIKKEKELKNGKWYYKVMANSFLWFWSKQFGSFEKKEADDVFYEMSKARNITISN